MKYLILAMLLMGCTMTKQERRCAYYRGVIKGMDEAVMITMDSDNVGQVGAKMDEYIAFANKKYNCGFK